jgi:hypothetical protein
MYAHLITHNFAARHGSHEICKGRSWGSSGQSRSWQELNRCCPVHGPWRHCAERFTFFIFWINVRAGLSRTIFGCSPAPLPGYYNRPACPLPMGFVGLGRMFEIGRIDLALRLGAGRGL